MTARRSVASAIGRLPLSVRLGTAFASVFLLVLTTLVALAYWALGTTLRGELDRALVDAVAQVQGSGLPMARIHEREVGGVESSEIETQLLSRSGRVLDASDDDLRRPLLTPGQMDDVLTRGVLFTEVHDGNELQRVLARPSLNEEGGIQVLAVEMDSVVESQGALLNHAGPLAALAGLLSGLTGWLVARRGLAPVTALAAQAGALNARDLSRRLELHRSRDEVARLGQTLNEMLSRIEDARQRERQFTADASHELRTPLAILRVVKTHQGSDKGRTAWAAMRALWESPVARNGVVTLAEPLAYLPDERVLVQGPVQEDRTLKEVARDALTDGSAGSLTRLRKTLDRTATALAALHRSGAEYGRTATWEEELAEVREVVARLATTVPHVGSAAQPLVHRLRELDGMVPADPVVSAHHDFRPAQVLLHQERIGFIDFDGACRAEPGLDLGRFRAKLRDIGISAFSASGRELSGAPLERHLRLLDDLCDGFLAEYQRHAAVTVERVVLWETTDLLTALLHAWTKVRTARVGPRLAVLEHAAASMSAIVPV